MENSNWENLLGEANTKKIKDAGLDKLIDVSELTSENLEYAQDFFDNFDIENVSDYLGDEFTFLDVVKKFYDCQLPLDVVSYEMQRKIILDRRFTFVVKKKIVDVLNSLEEINYVEKFWKLLDLLETDDEFLNAEFYFKEIVASDKLYEEVLNDKKKLPSAVNIVKYNMHNFKNELSFDNLNWIVDVLMVLPVESQNIVRIWINHVKSDDECKKLQSLLVSIIDCQKLTDDVSYKRCSVSDAIEIYNDIKSKVHNKNLSSKNLNSAFSLVLALSEDKNFDEKRLKTVVDLISLIRDDYEFEQSKIFINLISVFDTLPDILIKNDFTLIEVLPVMLKIYFMDAKSILKKKFSFDNIREIVKILEKCNKDDSKINNVLELVTKIQSNEEFDYCKDSLLKLAKNKKMMSEIRNNKISLYEQVKKMYMEYFRVSSASSYTVEIIKLHKFSFKIIKQMDRLISERPANLRRVVTNLILKLSNANEFMFAKKFLCTNDSLESYEQSKDILSDIIDYYSLLLHITFDDKNKLNVINNTNLSFENLADAVNLISNEKQDDKANKLSILVSMISDDNEYKTLQPFFYKLIDIDKIFEQKTKILPIFFNVLYDLAEKLNVRKIFNNRFLSLRCKSKALDYLKEIDDSEQRDRIANLICIIKSDEDYDKISPYFNKLMLAENLSSVIFNSSINVNQIIQICNLGVDKIWLKNVISFDRLKKLATYLVKLDEEMSNLLIEFIYMLESNEEFDNIFPHIDDLLNDKRILQAVKNVEISINEIVNLYSLGVGKIFTNKKINFVTISQLEKILNKITDKEKFDFVMNIAINLTSDKEFAYMKEFLISGNVESTNKSYLELARDFYVKKLGARYAKKNKEIFLQILKLVGSYKFSYDILDQMSKALSDNKNGKSRAALFEKFSQFKDDDDFTKNSSQLDNLPVENNEVVKESFSSRMKKAEKNAESFNNDLDSGSGMSNNSSSLVFDDGNLVVNVIDVNAILQFKDKKVVIMTSEKNQTLDKTTRGKFTALSIKINEEIDKNLNLFEDPQDYFDEFMDYLNEHGDSASLEDDQDDGETYCCLITSKNLDEIITEHENFIAEISS